MFETASEIVIWMVLAALVGFATGWALRSVVANRARARLSERLDEKRRETQELREEVRLLRGGDDDVMQAPGLAAGAPVWEDDAEHGAEAHEEPTLGATAEHDEVELGPLDEPEPGEEEQEEGGVGGSTRAMRLEEIEWDDPEEPPHRRDDGA
jgi:hypothetical protein